MRVRFLTCFIFVLCTQAIPSLCFHANFSSDSEHKALNLSNTNIQTNQPLGNYGSIKKAIREEDEEIKYDSIKKAQRGKGSTGGANANNRPGPRRSVNSAPLLLPWISTLCVSLSLVSISIFSTTC